MIWALLLFANGTALMVFNATVTATVFNITLPVQPLSAPVVELDRVPVPALFDGKTVSVVTGGRGLVTIRYVPKIDEIGGLPAINITTSDVVIIWANGSLLVIPNIKIFNYTRVDKSLVIVAKGPGYIAYAIPRPISPPYAAARQNNTTTPAAAASQLNKTQPATAMSQQNTSAVQQLPASYTTSQNNQSQRVSPPSGSPLQTTSATVGGSVESPLWLAGWWLAALAGAAAFATALLVLKRGAREVAKLGDVDRQIFEYVKKTGGAYEADIARDLGIPRTTVFRAVRRLAEQGLVVLEKRNGRNWVAPADS